MARSWQLSAQGVPPRRTSSKQLGRIVGSLSGLTLTKKWVSVSPDKLPTILPSCFEDVLLGGTPCAESCHERAILAAQDHDVWIRLVKIVVERRKLEVFHP